MLFPSAKSQTAVALAPPFSFTRRAACAIENFTIRNQSCQVSSIGTGNHQIANGGWHSSLQAIVVHLEHFKFLQATNFRWNSPSNAISGKPNLSHICQQAYFGRYTARKRTVGCRKCNC